MTGLEHIFILLGIGIGTSIAVGLIFVIGFVAEMYTFWQLGRYMAVQVTEKNHTRRLELLAKMIEREQAMELVEKAASPEESISPMAVAEMKREDGRGHVEGLAAEKPF